MDRPDKSDFFVCDITSTVQDLTLCVSSLFPLKQFSKLLRHFQWKTRMIHKRTNAQIVNVTSPPPKFKFIQPVHVTSKQIYGNISCVPHRKFLPLKSQSTQCAMDQNLMSQSCCQRDSLLLCTPHPTRCQYSLINCPVFIQGSRTPAH